MDYSNFKESNADNHKLIIVMDHSTYFTTSSDPNKWLESFCMEIIPTAPKSLWACMVESVMEFCRIVWNIYPRNKLIQVVVCNYMAHIMNTWDAHTQSSEYLSEVLSSIGTPPSDIPEGEEISILHGLRGALESLVVYTPLQREKLFDDLACMAKTDYTKLNRGRIICITSLSSTSDLKILTDLFLRELVSYNIKASHSNFQQLPITHCHLIIINVHPSGTVCDIVDQPKHEITRELLTELHVVDALHLFEKMSQFLIIGYDLACTIIDEIPSHNSNKEKDNSFFEIEMFHSQHIHDEIAKDYPNILHDVRFQGAVHTRMRLHWSYQDLEVTDIITSMTRITPADIRSPGAIQLIKHLFMGTKVLLEFQTKSGIIIKYMVAVQEGDIFLHTLMVPREVPAFMLDANKAGSSKVKKTKSTKSAIAAVATVVSDEKAATNSPIVTLSDTDTADSDTTLVPSDEVSESSGVGGAGVGEDGFGEVGFGEAGFGEAGFGGAGAGGIVIGGAGFGGTGFGGIGFGNADIGGVGFGGMNVVGTSIFQLDNETGKNVSPMRKSIMYTPHVRKLLNDLLTTFVKMQLNKTQIEACTAAIKNMKTGETNGSRLNLPSNHFFQASPLTVQYQVLWDEMQIFLEDNQFTLEHRSVLNFFKELVRCDESAVPVDAPIDLSVPTKQMEKPETSVTRRLQDPVEDTRRRFSLLDFVTGMSTEPKAQNKRQRKLSK